ncbi:MAG: helix-turn-helix domain-containing protein [Bacillota bacterium]
MNFKDKLSLLMNIQNTSNSRLAKALSVDPSLISRWKAGTRTPSDKSTHFRALAKYFSDQAKQDYQVHALYQAIGLPYEKRQCSSTSLYKYLCAWLENPETQTSGFIHELIKKLEASENQYQPKPVVCIKDSITNGETTNVELYYGKKGKRNGVLRFLTAVITQSKPCTMLLYSDESMEWLTEDKEFYTKWGMLLLEAISKGNRIRIIHNVQRDLTEMHEAIERWLPLYLTGAIEPYYYPKLNDGTFRRTMFIAPEIAALTSSSLFTCSEDAVHAYVSDSKMLQNLTNEFNEYLSICKPLMQIYGKNQTQMLSEEILEFYIQPGNHISISDMPSLVTMPIELYSRLLDNNGFSGEDRQMLLKLQKKRINAFLANLSKYNHTEIITLPAQFNDSSCLSITSLDPTMMCKLQYTSDNFSDHLLNIINLMDEYNNFSVVIMPRDTYSKLQITVKEGVGVVVLKNDDPLNAFTFSHRNMTFAFSNYLEDLLNTISKKNRTKKYVLELLKEMAHNYR